MPEIKPLLGHQKYSENKMCWKCEQESMKIVGLNILYKMTHLMNAQIPFYDIKVHF